MTIRDQVESVEHAAKLAGDRKNRIRALWLVTQYDSWNRLASSKDVTRRKDYEHERLDVEREMGALLLNLESEKCGK